MSPLRVKMMQHATKIKRGPGLFVEMRKKKETKSRRRTSRRQGMLQPHKAWGTHLGLVDADAARHLPCHIRNRPQLPRHHWPAAGPSWPAETLHLPPPPRSHGTPPPRGGGNGAGTGSAGHWGAVSPTIDQFKNVKKKWLPFRH